MRRLLITLIAVLAMVATGSAQEKILYIGLQDTLSMMRSDSTVIAELVGMGYDVRYAQDDSLSAGATNDFDFSPYKAAVIGEQCSSGKITEMVARYGYPLPIVNLKGFMMRHDKWGWVQTDDGNPPADNSDYPGFIEDKGAIDRGGDSLAILTGDHYITQDFNEDDTIQWSTMPSDYTKAGDFFAYGFDLTRNMSGAVPLAKNTSTNITDEKLVNIWAVPAVTMLGDSTTMSSHRMVIMGTKCFGIADDEEDLGGISFLTADFITLIQRSVEWVLGAGKDYSEADAGEDLLFIGLQTANKIMNSDKHVFNHLRSLGYEVHYVADEEVMVAGFDFSPYKAAVIGEQCSSGKITDMVTNNGYPLPIVNLKGFMMRHDKWGWVQTDDGNPPANNSDYPGYIEDRDDPCTKGGKSLAILDADHYITQDFDEGDTIAWSTMPCDYDKAGDFYAYGYDLTRNMSGAVPLARNTSSNITDEKLVNIWAVPAVTMLGDSTTMSSHRMVILGTKSFGLADDENTLGGISFMTEDLLTLIERSVEWALGAGKDYSEEDEGEDLLYIGLQTANKIMNSDKHVFNHLRSQGYQVHYVADEEVMVAGFDFSPYKAAVIGEQCSSGKITDMVTNNGYPLPIVNLKGFMMRHDKWGWVQTDDGNPPADNNNYPGYIEDRDDPCTKGGKSLAILDADHYITQDFDVDDTIAWSTMPCDYDKAGDFFAYGYDLTRNMSGAVPLARNTSTNITDEKLVNIWAVPAVNMLGDSTTMSSHRMVILGTKSFGIADDENTLGGISFLTEDFLKLLDRSVEWSLGAGNDYSEEDEGEDLLYIGLQTVNKIMNSDKHVFNHLRSLGYEMQYVADEEVMVAGFDFSLYKAAVIGEQCSSGKITDMVTNNGYPLPIVNLKGFMMRHDKWGWVQTDDGNPPADNNDYPGYIEDRADPCAVGGKSLAILNDDHYITQDFDVDDTIAWSTMPCDYEKAGDFFAYGYDLTRNMSGAVPLARNTSTNITDEKLVSIWAVPAITMLGDSTTMSSHRMVILGTKSFGIADDENTLGGISFLTEDFLKLLDRSVEWSLGAGNDYSETDAGEDLLYIGLQTAKKIMNSDKHVFNHLRSLGYEMKYVADEEVMVAGFDFSPYATAVIGEQCSSGKITDMVTNNGYPLPIVNLKGFMMRHDKWGWVQTDDGNPPADNNNYPGYIEDRADPCAVGGKKMKILDADHYITQDFTADQEIEWSTMPCDYEKAGDFFAYGYDLTRNMSGAVPLTINMSTNITDSKLASIWAIPAITMLGDSTTMSGHRMVIMGTKSFGLADDENSLGGISFMTDDLLTLIERSVEWTLGAGKDYSETDEGEDILYIGLQTAKKIMNSDKHVFNHIRSQGYQMHYVADEEVMVAGFDFSSYAAAVIGEQCSSGKITDMVTNNGYPLPIVNLKGFMMRHDKWGWVQTDDGNPPADNNNYPGYIEDRSDPCAVGGKKMKILDVDHYITRPFTVGQEIEWSTMPCDYEKAGDFFAYGYDLTRNMSGAVPLTINMSTNITDEKLASIWAVPAYTKLGDSTTISEHRMVIMGTKSFGLADDENTLGGISFMTADLLTLIDRSLEWILGANWFPDSTLLYAGATNPAEMLPSDAATIDALEEAGYFVHYVDDNDVNEEGFDYSPFMAVVFGESISSSKVVPFGKRDNYPIPSVVLEPQGPRDSKWGWIGADDYLEERAPGADWNKLKILENEHYITQDYDVDEIVTWTDAPAVGWAYSMNLNIHTTDAVALGINQGGVTITDPFFWTVEAGSAINDSITVGKRMVIFGIRSAWDIAVDDDEDENYGTIYATDDFFNIIVRSVDWVLGAEYEPDAVNDLQLQNMTVSLYPNPVTDQATLRFVMDKPDNVSLRIMNLAGQTVKIIEGGYLLDGWNELQFNVDDLSHGMHLFRLEVGQNSYIGKFNVIR